MAWNFFDTDGDVNSEDIGAIDLYDTVDDIELAEIIFEILFEEIIAEGNEP
jgi:hypothetical protein